jgi:hypothetical protein
MAGLLGLAKTQRRNPMNVVPMLDRLQSQYPGSAVTDDLKWVYEAYRCGSMAYEDAMQELDMARLHYQRMAERNLLDLVQRAIAVEEGKVAA